MFGSLLKKGLAVFSAGLIYAFSLSAALAQLNGNIPNSQASPFSSHQPIAPGPTPTVSSCGTSPSVSGNDEDGLITTGTGTPAACTLTFAVPFNSVPYCTAAWASNLASMTYTVSTTGIAITQTATNSTKITYSCIAQPGG